MADQPQIPGAKPVIPPAPPAANPAAQQAASGEKACSGKVAVIAVHGVAYHKPGDSANAMAELLLSLPAGQPNAPRAYSSFEAETIHIALKPVQAWPAAPIKAKWRAPMERGELFATELRNWVTLSGIRFDRGSTGHEFSRLLLQEYKGAAAGGTFITNRLKGRRAASAPGGAAEVHIYESYWADLARPENTIGRFFTSVFQLLLHLSSLSRLAVETGTGENPGRRWHAYQKSQEWAVRILQVPIPILNLVLLIAALSVLPRLVAPATLPAASLIFAAAGGIGAGFWAARKLKLPVPADWMGWVLLPPAGALFFASAGWLLLHFGITAETLAALEWWGVGALLVSAMLHKYAEVREGTQRLGWSLYLAALALFVLAIRYAPRGATPKGDDVHLTQAALWTVQWILAGLRTYWTFTFFWAIAASVLGWWALSEIPQGTPQRARAHAAVRTSRLAIALPSVLMLLMIIFLWGGVFRWITDPKHFNPDRPLFAAVEPDPAPLLRADWVRRIFCYPSDVRRYLPHLDDEKDEERVTAQCDKACVQRSRNNVPYPVLPNDYFSAALVWSIGPGLPSMIALMAIALFYIAWWVLPSVATETIPLRGSKQAPRWSTNAESLHLGKWHSRGLDALPVVTFFLWSAAFAVITIWMVASAIATFLTPLGASLPDWLLAANQRTHGIIQYAAQLTASLAVLGLVVRYTSSALGIVLDVDNYLRASPAAATPRAKIMERYVSLLRHVAAFRDPQGRSYDRVVIIAHSLGALISADLLRFLHQEGDADLALLGLGPFRVLRRADAAVRPQTPITLFTMGNPLRQLLNRFFPYLYDWMREVPDGGLGSLGPATLLQPPDIPAGAPPNPAELGVERWVNAYRSGDYVGREVWLNEWYGRNVDGPEHGTPDEPIHVVPQDGAKPEFRSEMCIGEGAHQHYWDDTAPDIAGQLDALIRTP